MTRAGGSRTIELEPIRYLTAMRVFAGTLLVVITASAVCAQSLADVARKEGERRKAQPQPTKVYTNKDLAPAPPVTATSTGGSSPDGQAGSAASSAPAPTGAGAADGKGASDAASKDDKKDGKKDDKEKGTKDQAYWAGRMKSLQDALDHDTTFADALQSRVNALTTDFVNRDDPAQRAVIERDRQKALNELDRLKKQIIEDRTAIADLEEEARRAGVPPGWLR